LTRLLVIKLGGSVFADGATMSRCAKLVSRLTRENRVVVVVSAIRGATDELIRFSNDICENPPPELFSQAVAMGERTSARLFSLALTQFGVKNLVVDVDTPVWPVITDEDYLDATPLPEECSKRAREKLTPLLEMGVIPVVCGFIGLTLDGRVTLLGRGGSDTTATLLGGALGADEVILIKDVDGIYTFDPKQVSGAKPIERLTLTELSTLTNSGAKVVHEKSLRYVEGFRLRITSLTYAPDGGTLIYPERRQGESTKVLDKEITLLSLIGLDGSKSAELLGSIRESGGSPEAYVFNTSSARVYATGTISEKAIHSLVAAGIVKAFALKKGLRCVQVSGKGLETEVGVIHRLVQPLSANGINIFGLAAIGDVIKIFVADQDAKRALELIEAPRKEVARS
jgi:aspartate kinase